MTPPRLSRRVADLAPSPTAAVARAAQALMAHGVDVVDFGLGEPDFPTPDFVARAGIAAIEAGRTKYTDSAGDPGLRDAIAEKYRREQATPCARENVLVTAGAKQAVFNICQALFEEGDAVAMFVPYWVSFPEIVRLCGAQPLFVPSDIRSGWKPTAAALERAATKETRGVILNSPCNPSGALVEPEELARILGWCAAHEAVLLFDETYDHFLYDGRRHASAASFWSEHPGRIVVTGAASKTYAMTGWRLGWALAPKELVSAMASYQSHSTSNASSISQEAAREALADLERSEISVADMLAHYSRRREVITRLLSAIPGVECVAPEGAFYVFPRVEALYPRKNVGGSVEFCRRLLDEARVAAVPGEAFGMDSCVRFSFATSLDRIEEGLRRFESWLRT
ncbi:MAG TPA: pyridoxal phosphate-dependent aminotransferase [Thermoanaerobaculia bacterium]